MYCKQAPLEAPVIYHLIIFASKSRDNYTHLTDEETKV